MNQLMRHLGRILVLSGLGAILLTGYLLAQTPPVTVRGHVASLSGQDMVVKGPSGDVKATLTDKTIIRAEVPIKLSEINSGMYLGTTATKQPDGTFLASEVHIFSEDQRGTGEGHRPLGTAPQSGATMTNANVEQVEDVQIKDIKGRMIDLKYKDGSVKVLVPPNIPLVKRVLSDRSALKNGVEVSLQGAPGSNGALAATQITIRAGGR
jgi:hypothetical protein